MRHAILAASLLLAGTLASAQERPVSDVEVRDLVMKHSGRYLAIDFNIGLDGLDVKSNRAVLLTPVLSNGSDSLVMPAVGIYGRNRYFFYLRNGETMISGADETSFRSSETPVSTAYHQVLDFKDWMDGAELRLHRDDYGCCSSVLAREEGLLGSYEVADFFPQLVFVKAQAASVKDRDLEGSALIDFIVDRTDIRPDYRNNVVELGKIKASVDSLKTDGDITIKSVWLKGFASPESPWSHNKDLAIGRTEAVKGYIRQLYDFADSEITTDYEPENWEGLRAFVEASNLDNRQGILELIDSPMEPDAKEAAIKRTYPKDYSFLLQNCYPALRRTDYRIAYNIRTYTDIDEIQRIMAEAPHKLSLNEFNLLAQQYEPGSDEFTEVYETAVMMYPKDEVANLNAASAALRRRDTRLAARYIKKMGDSPQAVYTRGAYSFLTGDFETAKSLFERALALGVAEAEATLADLDRQIEQSENNQ